MPTPRALQALLARGVHSSAASRALPALADDAKPAAGFLSSLFGGSTAPTMPPMSEPLSGVAVPPYSPPASPPVTLQKKLANGAVLAAEETPVRAAGGACAAHVSLCFAAERRTAGRNEFC
jgi:hypothetical protein